MNYLQRLALLLGAICAVSTAADVVCGSSQYIPNPDSCSSYYECTNGNAVLINCPPGLEFSVASSSCNYPALAHCGSSSGDVTTAANLPNYYCPEVDGTSAYIYPNPLSCTSYYMCGGGTLHLYQCQAGLEYDVQERGCDYPERAKCDLNNLPTFPSGPTAAAPTTTTPGYDGPIPGYYCPEVDGATAYIYPNPLSCTSYFMCAGGSLHYYKCQAGLEYDVEERGCDYPERAKCNLNNLPTFPAGPTTPAPVVGPTPAYYCPEVDGASAYIYPNPLSCTSYYMCAGGSLHLYQCQTGLEYDVEERGCDYPERAKCNLNNLPTFPAGPTTPAAIVGPTPAYYCPEVDGASAYIYPNPLSCTSYYMCAGGSLHLYQCQTGLEYDVEERGCDYPERAKCNLNNLPTFPSGPTAAAPTTTTPGYDGPIPGYYCPEVDGATAYIYPNPLSCTSYFMCAGGSLHYYKCLPGLEYDVEERGCDYPERAKCNLNNLPSYPTGPTEAPAVTSTAAAPANVVCPANVETLVRDPTDCSKFYSCNYGTLIRESCSAGLYFSQSEQDCDYPGNVPECAST